MKSLLFLAMAIAVAAPGNLQAQQKTGAGAFAVEAAGGIAGSLIGFGIGVAIAEDDCGDDVVCDLSAAATAVALGTALSAAGTYVAGKLADTKPSGLGSILGSIAGAAAGVGMWHLVSEELSMASGQGAAMVTFSVTQGTVTALGSRLFRAL